MKVFEKGYDDQPTAEFDLGLYGFVRFAIGGRKVHVMPTKEGGLRIRLEDFGCLKVLPRVANEVVVGVED